ncbi:serine hydrolase [Bacillus sp. MUM 116]|uniref:serine hydrolase domain-containing protein n=1 Tax=Bacillus sp. MUM 116 TaxID=1678002 RepID=UPI0015A59C1B|nr:serine hydrolase domain-containing protein [Bacillus sp. MUM 116]
MNRTNKRKLKRKFIRIFKRSILLFFSAAIIITITIFFFHSLNDTKSDSNKIRKHKSKNVNLVLKKTVTNEVVDVNHDPTIDSYLKSLNFNGTALVVKDNKVLINKGYGYADFEKKVPNNSKTVFYIGSITKVFISASIMQLQELGKLNINDYLSKYISDFPNGNQIKLFHLLTHTSGIPEHLETKQEISHGDLIKKIGQGHLKFPPGTKWNYSDSNYSILAYILEKVTKEPLDVYVKEHIFNKAGMKHTGFGDEFYHEPYISKGYKLKDNSMISPSLPDMSELFGCGDIYTTPYDMYLFDKALYNGELFSKSSLQLFFTPFKENYAFGMYRDPGSYSDHGVLPGFNSLNSFSRSGKKFVVLFSNIQNGVKSLGVVNNQIFNIFRN